MESYLGVDISKSKVDAALLNHLGKYKTKVFPNTAAGSVALVHWLNENALNGALQVHICIEATGTYHEQLALHLYDQGLNVSIIDPMEVGRFIELEGTRKKTGGADARSLARFCRVTQPPLWLAPSRPVRALEALMARLDTLQQLRQSEIDQLDLAHGSVQSSIQAIIATLDRNIEEVKSRIRQSIDDDPDLRQRDGLLQTIPELGGRTIPQ